MKRPRRTPTNESTVPGRGLFEVCLRLRRAARLLVELELSPPGEQSGKEGRSPQGAFVDNTWEDSPHGQCPPLVLFLSRVQRVALPFSRGDVGRCDVPIPEARAVPCRSLSWPARRAGVRSEGQLAAEGGLALLWPQCCHRLSQPRCILEKVGGVPRA